LSIGNIINTVPEMMTNQLTLDNFNMLSVIGKGSYAKVVLVKKKGDNNDKVYAMKILKKKYIEKRKQ
jgi:serum/glucocorticoid-regulated kinase 2